MPIHQWLEISKDFTEGLLLGNGASMAIHREFGYEGLFQAARDHGHITPAVAAVFDAFKVNDFELVLRRLWEATVVNKTLDIPAGRVEEAYIQVRTALIATVREVHISHDDVLEHLEPIYMFMKNFKTVISLNYDLIVYWAAMQSQEALGVWFKDCFLNGSFADDWGRMRKPLGRAMGTTLFFYPHGNLALARGIDDEETKISGRGEEDLLTRVLDVWEQGKKVPLFVCEGTSSHKEKSIKGSAYLRRVNQEVLPLIGDSLVIYGWGMAEQEQHILNSLKKSKCIRAAVSVYNGNKEYMRHAEEALVEAGLKEVVFFDSASPSCWHNPPA
jgi:hypothetical protein